MTYNLYLSLFFDVLMLLYHIISYIVHFSGTSSKPLVPQPLTKQVSFQQCCKCSWGQCRVTNAGWQAVPDHMIWHPVCELMWYYMWCNTLHRRGANWRIYLWYYMWCNTLCRRGASWRIYLTKSRNWRPPTVFLCSGWWVESCITILWHRVSSFKLV